MPGLMARRPGNSSGQIVSTSAYARHMVSLSVRDRESFLAEPHVAALSGPAGQGRGPLTVPVWYQYKPGGEVWVLTPADGRSRAGSRTAEGDLIARSPRTRRSRMMVCGETAPGGD